MKIVIDINDEDYRRIQDIPDVFNSLTSRTYSAIRNGTLLPEKRTEERTESHACDCISREAVIEAIETDCSWDMFNEWGSRTPTGESIIEAIKRVPSVEPERKMGKWLPHMVTAKCESIDRDVCSECRTCFYGEPTWSWKYCPMCGAKMEVDG